MINSEKYISQLTKLLEHYFDSRLLYVGLQGSYMRGEATEDSDIDIMVVIDTLTVADLERYRAVIQSMEHSDKACGFICSRSDLTNWNPMEICHILHTTKDCYGTLSQLVPAYSRLDVQNFVKVSLNNLYHEICHRYIYGEHPVALHHAYKSVFFILQNLYYLQHGKYIASKAELLSLLDGKNRDVLECSIQLSQGLSWDFQKYFELLFIWCQETLQSIC